MLLVAALLGLTVFFTRGYWRSSPVDICFTGDADKALREIIPSSLGKTDVLFAFDQSGSMGGMIDGAKRDALELMRFIASRLGSEQFGVAGFSDYIDVPYRLYYPISRDYDAVQDAINGLSLVDGGDAPEAYGRLMYESYADPAIGWRDRATHYLIIFGDSYPHDPDAGRDGLLGTSDDLILNNVLDQMAVGGPVLIFVADPGVSGSDLLDQWAVWSQRTGGSLVRCQP